MPEHILPEPHADTQPAVSSDITVSPFYNSAVNAVTKPNKATWTSNYFIDRWMPLLGGNGTMIVLALRRDGFLNRKTGERRDEIVVDRPQLARLAGISEDTLTRELGTDKKTGKPRNAWLHLFVQKRTRNRRDHLGRVWREESAYWVSMDDPIHPDDWHLVEQAVRDAEERREKQAGSKKQAGPKTQSALSVAAAAPQNAAARAQNADDPPQNAAPKTQFALTQKSLDSSKRENTSEDAAAPPPPRDESRQDRSREPEFLASLSSEQKGPEQRGPGAAKAKGPRPMSRGWWQVQPDSPGVRAACERYKVEWRGPDGG